MARSLGSELLCAWQEGLGLNNTQAAAHFPVSPSNYARWKDGLWSPSEEHQARAEEIACIPRSAWKREPRKKVA